LEIAAARDPFSLTAESRDSIQSRVAAFLSYAILFGGIITMGITVYMVVVSYSSLPYVDGWDEVGAAAYGSSQLTPAWLWVQHSEHRLIIPKLFLAIDLSLFQASQKFLLGSILAVQFLHLILLAWSMRVLGNWRGAVWRTGVGLAAFCLFCSTQWENFVWGFQVCFVLPGLFATMSFVALLMYWRDSRQPHEPRLWAWLVVANLAALGATYSLANGNLLWPILIAAAILLRLKLPATLSFVLTGAVSSGLYFAGYIRPPWHADPLSSLREPIRLMKYLAGYFGSSWLRLHFHLAGFLGLAGLGIALAVILRLRAYVTTRRAFAIQLSLTLLFCVGTAFVTALGRLNFGSGQALAPRYQTIALLFWCCLGLMALLSSTAKATSDVRLVFFQICLLAVMASGVLRAQSPIADARVHGSRLDRAAMSLLTDVSDPENFKLAQGQQPQQLVTEIKYLRSRRLSVFSSDAYLQLDTPLSSTFRVVAGDECRGASESTTPLESRGTPAWGITGWAWDYKHQRPPVRVIATVNGVITGLAAVGQARPTIRSANPDVKTDWIGFAGYVRDVQPATPVSLYAVLGGNPPEACPIATLNYSEVK
jgi:hypothetical protein